MNLKQIPILFRLIYFISLITNNYLTQKLNTTVQTKQHNTPTTNIEVGVFPNILILFIAMS